MAHEIAPFDHIISQRIAGHFRNDGIAGESVECRQAVGKSQREGNLEDFGNDKGENAHAQRPGNDEDDHRPDDGNQHIGGAVLQAVEYEHHQGKHDNPVRTGTAQRVLFEEAEVGEDDAQNKCPDSAINGCCLTEQDGKPGDETEFSQHEDRCIEFLRHFRNQCLPVAVIGNSCHADMGITFDFFRRKDDFSRAELFQKTTAFSLQTDSRKRIAVSG